MFVIEAFQMRKLGSMGSGEAENFTAIVFGQGEVVEPVARIIVLALPLQEHRGEGRQGTEILGVFGFGIEAFGADERCSFVAVFA